MSRIILTVMICHTIEEPGPSMFVIWNVGQGLWTSAISLDSCIHFDSGGEKWPSPVIKKCLKKFNTVFLTHQDWDHISFRKRFANQVSRYCSHCSSSVKDSLQQLSPCRPDRKSRNARSLIFTFNEKFLIPGDSLKKQERRWVHQIRFPVKVLILGHHGSQTSTGAHLIKRLRHLKMTVASARKGRYGHPHKKVVARLKKANLGVLTTEDWGHIGIEYTSHQPKYIESCF